MTTTRVRGTKFKTEASSQTSAVFTTASSLGAGAPATGNLVVVVIESFGPSGITPPSGWALDRSITVTTGGSGRIEWYSRPITGSELSSYTWTFPSSFCSAYALEWNSTNGSGWLADTGASDLGTASSVTSRAMGASAALAQAEEAVVAFTGLNTTPSTGYAVTGGPTFTEVAAGSQFDHVATGVTASASALSLTGGWTTSNAVYGQGFQTYYVPAPAGSHRFFTFF